MTSTATQRPHRHNRGLGLELGGGAETLGVEEQLVGLRNTDSVADRAFGTAGCVPGLEHPPVLRTPALRW